MKIYSRNAGAFVVSPTATIRWTSRYTSRGPFQVLITKLWSANNVETQQYRKASKALLVLIPLLGVTYVLVIAGPTEGQVANVFSYARAVLLSSQVRLIARANCPYNRAVTNETLARASRALSFTWTRLFYQTSSWAYRAYAKGDSLTCRILSLINLARWYNGSSP